MADKTGIAWADATINPAFGCSPVSPACDNCYAARMAARMASHPNPKVSRLYAGLTDAAGKWTGKINLHSERMEQALSWKRPRRIFVGSMTDLFHEVVPDVFLDKVFAYMAMAPQHTFILLTKRPARMLEYIKEIKTEFREHTESNSCHTFTLEIPHVVRGREVLDFKMWPLPNVILMATVEDQPRADERMPHLMALAGMGWRTGVSIEPMLGPVDLRNFHDPYDRNTPGLSSGHDWLTGEEWSFSDIFGGGPNWIEGDDYGKRRLHWVICGGESGPNARPLHPDWARGLRDQCASAGVPYFFKQWGEWLPMDQTGAPKPGAKGRSLPPSKAHWMGQSGEHRQVGRGRNTEDVLMLRVGKHEAGRLLDGVEHNAFPEVRS